MLNIATEDGVPWDADPHTPTPWSEFAESGDWWIQQCNAEGSPIGDPICGANDMSAADMGFIITACNAHDALVAALEGVQGDVCSYLCPSVKKTGEQWTHSEKCQAVTTALAKARANG